jgi:hypothetical protein
MKVVVLILVVWIAAAVLFTVGICLGAIWERNRQED